MRASLRFTSKAPIWPVFAALTMALCGCAKVGANLDTAFGEQGKALTSFGADSALYGLAQQGDGKILAVGQATVNDHWDFAIARYNADGKLDSTFNTTGKTTVDFNGAEDQATSVALQADKIIVAGFSGGKSRNAFAIARLLSNGTLDKSFRGAGKFTDQFSSDDRIVGVSIQTDGKILVAGTSYLGRHNVFVVARYLFDGERDFNFGQMTTSGRTGFAFSTFASGSDATATAMGLQSDGKIVIGGFVTLSSADDFAAARFTVNGDLDKDFGTQGLVTTDIGSTNPANPQANSTQDEAYALTFTSDRGILLAGTSNDATATGRDAFAVVKYRTDGSLDPKFGVNGKQITPFVDKDGVQGDASASAIASHSGSEFVMAGYYEAKGTRNFGLAQYGSNGVPNSSFGTGGTSAVQVNGNRNEAHAALIQSDGRLVVGGSAFNGTHDDFAVVRFQ